MNLNDLPSVAPYLFINPDWNTDEARAMSKTLPGELYGRSRLTVFCFSI